MTRESMQVIAAYTPVDGKEHRHILQQGDLGPLMAYCGLLPEGLTDPWQNQNHVRLDDESLWMKDYCVECLRNVGVPQPGL